MQGKKNEGQAVVTVNYSNVYRTEVNRPSIGGDAAAVDAVIPADPASYILRDLQFRIVCYFKLMPPEFYQSLSNTFGAGGVYKLWFPNYSVYTGNLVLVTNKSYVTSFSMSTKS
jgi:hypothetical protein